MQLNRAVVMQMEEARPAVKSRVTPTQQQKKKNWVRQPQPCPVAEPNSQTNKHPT